MERAEFTLNGTPVSVRADHPHLLSALREELDVTSPKDGCSPSGQCGCCTVLVDGKAVVSCNLGLDKIADYFRQNVFPAFNTVRRASIPTSGGATPTPLRPAVGCSAVSASQGS